jgi:Protein kinase domain
LITSDSMIDENNLVALVNSTYAEDFYGVRDSLTIYAAKLANLQIPNMMGLVACGEMMLQQFVYSCIAALFFAFRPLLYCADQPVTAYHGVESVPGVPFNVSQHSAACMPDGAIRLTEKYYIIAMMELKADNNDKDPARDPYQCVLMTSMALVAIERVRQEKNDVMTVKTALPFVIGKHDRAKLYVTRFVKDKNGGRRPMVQLLCDLNLGNATAADKSNFMAMLAMLVADIVTICNRLDVDLYNSFPAYANQNLKTPPNAMPSSQGSTEPAPKKAKSNEEKGKGKGKGSSKPGAGSAPASRENAALQAASRNGQLEDLHYPWPRVIHYNIDASAEEYIEGLWGHYQQRSPFYFTGIDSSSKAAMFCKVWKEGDPRTVRENIDNEIKFLKLAAQSGVPTAAVLEGLTAMDVPCSSGLEGETNVYNVLVMSHHHDDSVKVADLVHYGLLLVQAVIELHSIGILHCDIKPGNVLWDSEEKVVRLVDYGHAQFEVDAKSCTATPEFQAPEIEEGEPHTRMSDCFSVGKTLLCVIESADPDDKNGCGDDVLRLATVAQALAHESASARMSLEEAEKHLQSKSGEEGPHHQKVKPVLKSGEEGTHHQKAKSMQGHLRNSPLDRACLVCACRTSRIFHSKVDLLLM